MNAKRLRLMARLARAERAAREHAEDCPECGHGDGWRVLCGRAVRLSEAARRAAARLDRHEGRGPLLPHRGLPSAARLALVCLGIVLLFAALARLIH